MRDDVLARASLGVAAQQVLEAKRKLPPPAAVERELERALVESDDGEQCREVVGVPAIVHVRFGEGDVASGDDVAAKLPVAHRKIRLDRDPCGRVGGGAGAEMPRNAVGHRQRQRAVFHALQQREKQPAGRRQARAPHAARQGGVERGHRVVRCKGGCGLAT